MNETFPVGILNHFKGLSLDSVKEPTYSLGQ